jgi:hypothetical protein
MEMAFINGILRSPQFPPGDPWLSGMPSRTIISGTSWWRAHPPDRVQPNRGLQPGDCRWFALWRLARTALCSICWPYGGGPAPPGRRRYGKALLGLAAAGPFSILILSNIEGFLEVFCIPAACDLAPGSGWQLGIVFLNWLGILELNQPPTPPFTWLPERLSGIWCGGPRGVLNDLDLAHNSVE